eukprot:scaffold243338_cov31-Tisochrysis_lutea.AAC.6
MAVFVPVFICAGSWSMTYVTVCTSPCARVQACPAICAIAHNHALATTTEKLFKMTTTATRTLPLCPTLTPLSTPPPPPPLIPLSFSVGVGGRRGGDCGLQPVPHA